MAKGDWRKKPYVRANLESNVTSKRGEIREALLLKIRMDFQERFLTITPSHNRHWEMPRKIRRAMERDAMKLQFAASDRQQGPAIGI